MASLHWEGHRSDRIGWLRAAVLGANDGIVSTASLVLGVAAAEATRSSVLIAGVAGMVAGAMSMAAGEYVSVHSQADTEKADLARERRELATEPEAEREEVIRFNLSRVREYGVFDEVYLRTEIERVRQLGYAGRNTGLLEGMAGVAVPILDREGRAVAALSVGTIADRLNTDRMPTVVELLKREAAAIGPKINPFDATLRRPAQSLAG